MKRIFLLLLLISNLMCHVFGQRFVVKSLDVTNGLSSDYVMQMATDKYGFIWVATEEGLNRFDGSRFFSYYHEKNRNSITANELNCLLDDPQENKMWIGTQREGLNVFDYDRDEFSSYRHRADDPHSIITNDITSLSLAADKNLWLTTYWVGLEYFDRKKEKFHHFNQKTVRGLVSNQMWTAFDAGNGMVYVGHVYDGLSIIDVKNRAAYNYRHDARNPESISGNEVHCIFRSANGLIWVGTDKGLDLFDPLQGKFRHIADPRGTTHPVFQIKQMADGRLWLATELGGVVIIDIRQLLGQSFGNFKFDYISEGEGDGCLGGSSVRCMLEDSFHNVWIGLYGAGIDFVSQELPLFKLVTYGQVAPVYHLSAKSVMGLEVDHQGLLWAGTDGDGLNLLHQDMTRVAAPTELPGRSVQAIHCDSKGNMWIGTFADNAYVKSSGGVLRKLFAEKQDVRCFFEDGLHMWIGTSRGLYLVDVATLKVMQHYNLKSNLIRSVAKDAQGRIWIGTFGGGLLIYDSHMKFIHQLTTAQGFPSNTVNAVITGRQGRIWCATGEGVVAFQKDNVRTFTTYAAESHLNNIHIRAVAEDLKGNLWVSTNKGISCMKRNTSYFINYDYRDNVALGNYNPGSVAVSRSGMLYFGSTKGLTCFHPQEVLRKRKAPQVFVTAVDIPHGATFMKDSTLNLIGKQEVSLKSDENTFTVHFNVRNYALLGRIEYGYRLVGLQSEWQTTEENNITFNDLPYGSYRLEVKCRLHNQAWGQQVASLKLTIQPPFWLTWWAKLVYVLLTLVLLFWGFRFYMRKMRLEYLLAAEKKKHEQEQELNAERLRFFTNITHELRTPLTLIIGPIEDFARNSELSESMRHKLQVISHSAHRLQKLIGQILEFRKTETDSRRLCVVREDIVRTVHEVELKYEELNRKDAVKIRFEAHDNPILIYHDKEVVNIVVDNLVSNAIKYTDRGSITISVGRVEKEGMQYVEIAVHDTGHGISKSALPHIFERFYQENGAHQASGTGIGLALVKNLVALHQAEIHVASEIEKGSSFIVRLQQEATYPNALHGEEQHEPIFEAEPKEFLPNNGRELLLVVEDNPDIRAYIADVFAQEFEVREAADGHEGLQMALDIIPDMIISDVMMPNMDGNELCRRIKQNVRTSHVPIILLTAKSGNEAKEEGYEAGADSYLTKPFSSSLLKTRVHNLVEQRQRLLAVFREKPAAGTDSLQQKHERLLQTMGEKDRAFLDRLNQVLEQHIGDDLDISLLTDALNMSTSTLYRKMKGLTGMGTNEYIRRYRVEYAEHLLLHENCSVSDAAFRVGMNSVSYFRKSFKEVFGDYPTKYLKKIKEA